MLQQSPIYFDITDIVEHSMVHDTVTGIQRTVLRVIENTLRNTSVRDVFGIVKHPIKEGFFIADLSFMREEYSLYDFCSRFDLPSFRKVWLHRKLKKYKSKPAHLLYHVIRLNIQSNVSSKLRKQFKRRPMQPLSSCLKPAILAPGGTIISLGAAWTTDYKALNELARRFNCKYVSLVHDIIPISHTFFARDKDNIFRNWINYIGKESAYLLCNSEFTKKELDGYLRKNGCFTRSEVVKFPHEFKYPGQSDAESIRSEVISLCKQNFVLFVGTLDLRKNILGLVEAWCEIQKIYDAQTPKLVLCGGEGRGINDVYKLLNQTHNVNGTVTIIDKPDDAELALLYAHCKFTVFPSFFEGWGLPIGESLWFRKPVLSSNTTSMPEVGQGFATYFDMAQPGSLVAGLRQMIDNPQPLPDNIRDHLTTWEDTALSICSVVDADETAVFEVPSLIAKAG